MRVQVYRPTVSDPHWQCLHEVARGVAYSLMMLKRSTTLHVEVGDEILDERAIIFNSHRMDPEAAKTLSADAILYNAEQVPEWSPSSGWRPSPGWQKYIELLKRHVVWDYCQTNLDRLRQHGVERATHCRVGYWPGLASVPTCENENVDVLFVGSMNERRAMLIYDLSSKLKVRTAFGVYGTERDALMSQAKIILNAHFYANPIHEIFRTSQALANGKCVVSEGGGVDKELEAFAAKATALVTYSEIVDKCVDLAARNEARREQAKRGRAAIMSIDQITEVEQALKKSEEL